MFGPLTLNFVLALEVPLKRMLERKPTEIIRRAVWGMLPKNKLRAVRGKKLRLFAGPEHTFLEQVPPGTKPSFGPGPVEEGFLNFPKQHIMDELVEYPEEWLETESK